MYRLRLFSVCGSLTTSILDSGLASIKMYSTKFQVTQAQLLQAQQERMRIFSELEQVKQMQAQLKSQLDQILLLVKPLEQLQLYNPAVLRSQLQEIQAQLIQAQEERLRELTRELTPLQSPLSNGKTLLQSALEEPKLLQATISEVVPTSVLQSKASLELDELDSNKEVYYSKLRNLLAAGKWQEADQETKQMLLKVANIEQQDKFESEHLHNLSCEYLRGIDKLWLKYSKGHFGFTTQKRLFEKVGGKPGIDDYKAYCRFGEEVGWLVKNHWLSERDLNFSLNAPAGHLPIAAFFPLIRGIRSKKLYFCDFLSRIETCQH